MPTTGFFCDHQQWVCAELDNSVNATRPAQGPWETWEVEPQPDGTVAFKSSHGFYLSAQPDHTLVADRPAVGPWECFTAEPQPDGKVALRSWQGLYCFADPLGNFGADRAYDAPGPYELFVVTPWWQSHDRPAVPLLGTLSASFHDGVRDESGCVLPILCHAGDLLSRALSDQPRVSALLDQIAGAGYHGVRTWTVLCGDYWVGFTGECTPDDARYWPTLEWFCSALRARQLRWLVSQGDLMRWRGDGSGRRAYMEQLAHVLAAHGGTRELVYGVDAANEGGNNGEGDPSRLNDALQAFLGVLPTPIHTLTSAPNEENANLYLWGDALRDLHSNRGAWPKPGRRVFNIGYEAEPELYTQQSEGPGEGAQEYAGDRRVGHHVSVIEVPSEWNSKDPEIVGTLAALHAIGKAQYVFFCSAGVISDEDFTNYPSFARMPALYRRLPHDLQRWWTFHGGEGRAFSADRILAVPSDDSLEVRCDHAADGQRRICVIYGPRGQYTVKVVNRFRGALIHPGTLEEQAVDWQAGQMVSFDFARGRILLGEIGG